MEKEKKQDLVNAKSYKDKKWLEEALKTRTIKQIAEQFGVSGANISAYMKKLKIRSPRERGMGRLKYVNDMERETAKKNSLAKYQKNLRKNKKTLLVLLDPEVYDLLMEFKKICNLSNDKAITEIIKKSLKKVSKSVKK
jgi:predicted DNA binding protein